MLEIGVTFATATALGAVVNVLLVRDLVGFDAGVGWALAIGFGLVVAVATALRLDEHL